MAVSDGVQTPTPQVVGNAFVEQYYSILHQDPDQVHKFYHESSVLSRPEEDGTMTTVTTTAEIDKKIQSFDYTSYRVEVLSADAQPSYNSGVVVVVTGCLTGTDNVKRKFAQSFFLAPQDKGFYVLNDVFRYVDAYKSVDIETVPANDADESAPSEAFTPDPEPIHVAEDIPTIQPVIADTDTNISKEVSLPLENGKLSVTENVIPVNHVKESSHQEQMASIEKVPSNTQEDTPKKSFASIVSAYKDNSAPFLSRTSPAKPAVQPPRVHSVPAPEAPAPNMDIPSEKNIENGGRAHAIFVANLPMTATVEQLDRVFKKFGTIKRDGIQVRSNKGSCFGFVEFESAASLQSALELHLKNCMFYFRPPLLLCWTTVGFPLKKGEDVVDTEMTEMITSGAVATLVVAVVVALTEGMILTGEASSLAGLEEAIIPVEAMEMLHQGVIRMEEEKSLVNRQ
ncbi:unnamed protein product [Trifolium pratense]|uniref:Uncharacterized protein n=1 Tax=Trifolium pratense TaxID=57577 RepID=A0ACB0K2N5_TRIPR|nr:unnamed protein product [Trifolium pratense]